MDCNAEHRRFLNLKGSACYIGGVSSEICVIIATTVPNRQSNHLRFQDLRKGAMLKV